MSILRKSLISLSVLGLLSTSMMSVAYAKSKELVVAMNAQYPPFEYVHFGKKQGFDVELITKVASKLGMKVKFLDMPFASVIPSVKNGRADLAISSISATAERKKNFDFSIDYHTPSLVLVSQKASPVNSITDIKGKIIAAGEGTVQKKFIDYLEKSKKYGAFTKKVYEGNPIMVNELKLNRINAIVAEDVVGYTNQHQNKSFQVVQIANSVLPKGLEAGYAIAFQKSNPLRNRVNKVLVQLKKDGYIKKLETKWVKSALPK